MHPVPQYMVVKGLLCAMVKKEGGEGTEERVGGRDGGRYCRGHRTFLPGGTRFWFVLRT